MLIAINCSVHVANNVSVYNYYCYTTVISKKDTLEFVLPIVTLCMSVGKWLEMQINNTFKFMCSAQSKGLSKVDSPDVQTLNNLGRLIGEFRF